MHLQELRGTKDEIEERINTIAQQIAGALLLPRSDTPVIPVSCILALSSGFTSHIEVLHTMICMHELKSPKLVNVLKLTRRTLHCVMSLTGFSDVIHMLMYIHMCLPRRVPGAAAGQGGHGISDSP